MRSENAVLLTDKIIRATPAPTGKNYLVLRDDQVGGFGIRITPKDARAWVLTYHFEGQQRTLTIGAWPAWPANDARARAKELRREIDSGVDPLAAKAARREAPTVKDLCAAYLERYASKKKSVRAIGYYIKREILPNWSSRKVVDIQRRDVRDLVELKAATGHGIAANMLLSVIRQLFNWALDNEFADGLEHNPAARIKPPAEKVARDRWLSESEIKIFWSKLDTAEMADECRSALRLILILGQRPGEVSGAQKSEFDGADWLIPAERAKNGLAHGVPLSSLAIEEIQKLSAINHDSTHLLGSRRLGKGMSAATLSRALVDNRDHFGLAEFHPHDLRRTAATMLTKSCGVSQFIVGKILNHNSKSVTQIYDRYAYDAEKRAALARWDRELRRIIGKPVKAEVIQIAG